MQKSIKVFIGFIFLLVALVVGTLYLASSRLSPEEVKTLIVKVVEDTFPNSTLHIDEVSYNLGPSVSFEIKQFDLQLKDSKPGANLFSVDKVFVKVPIWAIFSGGGEIDVVINSPNVNYYEYQGDQNNWLAAAGEDAATKPSKNVSKNKKSQTDKEKSNSLKLPVFFANSRANIRMDNVNVFYQTRTDLKGEYSVKKLLLKNLSISESAAFEIQSNLKMATQDQKILKAELLLIGEINTPKMLTSGELQAKMELNIKGFSMTGLNYNIPDIKSIIVMSNEGNLPKLTANTTFGDLLDTYNEIELKDGANISKHTTNINLSQIQSVFGLSLPGVSFNDAKVKIAGAIDLRNERPRLNLKFNTTKAIGLAIDGVTGDVGLSGSLAGRNFNTDITGKILEGTYKLNASARMPTDIAQVGADTISKTRLRLAVDKARIPKEVIRNMIYRETIEEKPAETTAKTEVSKKAKNAKKKAPSIPSFLLSLRLNDIFLDKTGFSLNGDIASNDNKIAGKKIKMKLDKGTVDISFLTKFLSRKIDSKIDVKATKVDLESFNFALPTFLREIDGNSNFSVSGNIVNLEKEITYNLKLNSKFSNGSLKGFRINEFIEGYVQNIPVLNKKISKKDINLSEEFKTLDLSAVLKDTHYKVSRMKFVGIKNKASIQGSADIFPPKTDKISVASLTLTDAKGKLGQKLKKDVGVSSLPIRLEGKGYALSPDYGYTAKRLAKSAVKTQGKKAVKKEGKKLIDKYLKGGAKEQANKLLKGIFK